MQFQIPQDVQIEDKIVGPITMRQLIILGVGGGLDYVIYISLAKNYLWPVWMPPVSILALITLAIAFIKINEISFLQYIFYLIAYYIRAQKRTWRQMEADPWNSAFAVSTKPKSSEKKIEKKKAADHGKITRLDELTHILDSHGQMNKAEVKKHEKLAQFIQSQK